MNFLSRVVRYLFWVIVITWGIRLLRWLFAGSLREVPPQTGSTAQAGPEDTQGTARRLVRDPVCGTHVAEVLAIPLRQGSEIVHFCSTRCRDEYTASARKFAANS